MRQEKHREENNRDFEGGNMSKDKGYILLHRSLMENRDVWLNGEAFTKGQAWVDLLLLTQHSDYRGFSRGQCWVSQAWLAKRWGWSKKKVSRFLTHLVSLGMVTTEGTTKGTTLTIVNYGKYQNQRPTDDATDGPAKRPAKRPAKGTHIKNVYTKNDSTKNDVTTEEPAPLWDPQGRIYE